MNTIRQLQKLFSPWMIIGSLMVTVALVSATLVTVLRGRVSYSGQDDGLIEITVIQAPTLTPTRSLATATIEPIANDDLPPPDQLLFIGAYIQIVGTGGSGLRIRANPGLSSNVLMVGLESEIFEVRDGPVEEDGYMWWLLVAPYDSSVSGWAASNYMEIIQNP